MSDFFKFEKEGIDFPFYNHVPKISKAKWLLLLLSVVIAILSYGIVGEEFIGSLLFCIIMLIPLLYVANWNYKLFFQKPTGKELGLAVLLFVGYMIYSLSINMFVLDPTGTAGADSALISSVNIEMIVSLVFSMMAEELLKFIPFLFLMRVFFKFSNNRKVSLLVPMFIVMLGFGLFHYSPSTGGSLISVIVLQGLGTIFEFYGLIKTKNLLISYITHLLTDAFIMIVILLGL